MNQSYAYIKWFCRITLISIVLLFTYVATRPSYNFAHWVPHSTLRSLGVSYDSLLWMESNADVFLHFAGAFVITLLMYYSKLPFLKNHKFLPLWIIIALCIGAEFAQHLIGRGIETSDLLLGICGGFMAYLVIEKNN